jgi:uncharacterized protein YbjT (DUF2867 family)
LEKLGVERFGGDLKTPDNLQAACEGVDTVISTASSSLSRQSGDSIESVDLRGHLHLVDAAKRARVSHFIYVSFFKQEMEFPLQTAKRAVENELITSGMTYTIFQPVDFMEIWLGPALGFDPIGGKAQIFGVGDKPYSWISLEDVAAFVSGAVGNEKAKNRIFALGGPNAPTYLEVIRIFEKMRGLPISVTHVSEAELERQFAAATDPLARSFAALMLGTARGGVVTSGAAREVIPVQLTELQTYARRILDAGHVKNQ